MADHVHEWKVDECRVNSEITIPVGFICTCGFKITHEEMIDILEEYQQREEERKTKIQKSPLVKILDDCCERDIPLLISGTDTLPKVYGTVTKEGGNKEALVEHYVLITREGDKFKIFPCKEDR